MADRECLPRPPAPRRRYRHRAVYRVSGGQNAPPLGCAPWRPARAAPPSARVHPNPVCRHHPPPTRGHVPARSSHRPSGLQCRRRRLAPSKRLRLPSHSDPVDSRGSAVRAPRLPAPRHRPTGPPPGPPAAPRCRLRQRCSPALDRCCSDPLAASPQPPLPPSPFDRGDGQAGRGGRESVSTHRRIPSRPACES